MLICSFLLTNDDIRNTIAVNNIPQINLSLFFIFIFLLFNKFYNCHISKYYFVIRANRQSMEQMLSSLHAGFNLLRNKETIHS